MDFQQTLAYLYEHLPMFQRIGSQAIRKDLTNIRLLCEFLNHPERKLRCLHVAGTNGKGSSSHLLAAILQAAGYKTGLYTSPHLKSFTERIRVQGQPVPESFVVEFVERVKPFIQIVKPSFFEISVGMAFEWFAQQKVDWAVIEVGVGGRLDSTNIINPVLSLITNIGMDHMDLLGDTLPQIAFEKAGIIKKGVPAVVSQTQPEVQHVFLKKASEERTSLVFADQYYHVSAQPSASAQIRWQVLRNGHIWMDDLQPGLSATYQQQNLPGVLMAMEILQHTGVLPALEPAHIRTGIEQVVALTGLKGRWQQLGEKPYIFCDVGHNEDGIREVLAQMKRYAFRHLHMVVGMVRDKDATAILQLLPSGATYYFCRPEVPRGKEAHLLAEEADRFGLSGKVYGSVAQAIEAAKAAATPEDFVFIGGSTFVVAEIPDL